MNDWKMDDNLFEGTVTLDVIKRTREYLDYLEAHVNNVKRAWELVCKACPSEKFVCDDYLYHSITDMVNKHDLSKLYEEEFVQYRRHFYPVGNDFIPDEPGNDYDMAWEHHLRVNEHHWEYWVGKLFYDPHASTCHCVCILLDWLAMGMFFHPDAFIDNTLAYYNNNKSKIKLPSWAHELIITVIERISHERYYG